MIDAKQSVADLVLDHSECAVVFQRYRIDFCCRGDITIEGACAEKGVAFKVLAAELELTISERHDDAEQDPRLLGTAELIRHIVSKHHDYLRNTLPFVQPLAAKVSRVHGSRNLWLRELDVVVRQLAAGLITHLDTEEDELFPVLLASELDRDLAARGLASMHEEHLDVARLLDNIRAATEDFQAPDWACNSYRTLFAELKQLDINVRRHVQLEEHVLKPRFVWRAAGARTAQGSPQGGDLPDCS